MSSRETTTGGVNIQPRRYMEIGRSTTTPTQQTERKEVKIIAPYVVVGFEVNNPNGHAFDNLVQNLDIGAGGDYGHAFFYLVEDGKIVRLFSFGPAAQRGKVGWLDLGEKYPAARNGAIIKDGYADARPATANYPVTEVTRLFRVEITMAQAGQLKKEIDFLAKDISKGKASYTVWLNDTCAETARDLLDKADIKTPAGAGEVNAPSIGKMWFTMVNPYMWHHNFKRAGFKEATLEPMKYEWQAAQSTQMPDPALSQWKPKP